MCLGEKLVYLTLYRISVINKASGQPTLVLPLMVLARTTFSNVLRKPDERVRVCCLVSLKLGVKRHP